MSQKETISKADIESLKNRIGAIGGRLNKRHASGSRTALTENVPLNLMEIAVLEIALVKLLEGMEQMKEPT